jgi:hypothetical protein
MAVVQVDYVFSLGKAEPFEGLCARFADVGRVVDDFGFPVGAADVCELGAEEDLWAIAGLCEPSSTLVSTLPAILD